MCSLSPVINITVYNRVLFPCYCSQSILPDAIAGVVHNVPVLDTQWIEVTSKKAALKLEKLDTDLKNYKSNSIKESIR
jgi:COP9 signalosome complex subunit 1